eukprot:4970715-Pyramimonas_sp.AAC.1
MLSLVERGPGLLRDLGHMSFRVFAEEFGVRFSELNLGQLRKLFWEGRIDEKGVRRGQGVGQGVQDTGGEDISDP